MIPLVCCRPRTHQPHTMKYFGCTSARMRERRRHQPHSPGSLEVEKASKKNIPRIWLWTSQPRTRRVLYCTDMSLRLLSPLPHSNLLRSASVDSASLCSQVGAIQQQNCKKRQPVDCTPSGTHVCSHQPSNQRTTSRPRPHGQPLGRKAWICITGKPLSSWSWKCPVMMQCFCAAGIQ